jgi:hypothetical protein
MTRTFVVLSALAVAGCDTTDTTSTTAKVDMPSELRKSIAEYRACVDAKGLSDYVVELLLAQTIKMVLALA